jgi:hypothetical protein
LSDKTYKCWAEMKYRCDNPHHKDYPNYGARGITYCADWAVFENFRRDLGRKPKGLSLGRIDNSGPYCKENCRWETSTQQNNNRRKRRVITERTDSKTGIVGVVLDPRRKEPRWVAGGKENGIRVPLYYGPDFFEACCARKSWEAKQRLKRPE